jgi:hypothetical protein
MMGDHHDTFRYFRYIPIPNGIAVLGLTGEASAIFAASKCFTALSFGAIRVAAAGSAPRNVLLPNP